MTDNSLKLQCRWLYILLAISACLFAGILVSQNNGSEEGGENAEPDGVSRKTGQDKPVKVESSRTKSKRRKLFKKSNVNDDSEEVCPDEMDGTLSVVGRFKATSRQKCAKLRAVVDDASLADFPILLRETLSFDKGHTRTHVRSHIMNLWAKEDPEGAMRYASEADPKERDELMVQVIGGWAKTSLDEAYALVQQLENGKMKRDAMRVLIDSLGEAAKTNPDQALSFAMNLKSLSRRESAVSSVARSMSEEDIDGAREVLNAFEDKKLQMKFFEGMCRNWAKESPAEAAAFLEQLDGVNLNYTSAYMNIARGWAEKDLAQSLEWVESLESGRNRNTAIQQVLSKWGDKDPASAMAYALAMPASSNTRSITSDILRNAFQKNSETAMELLDQMPSWMQSRAISDNMYYIAETAPEMAALTVDVMPKGSQRNNALGSLASSWMNSDPESALEWMNGITDARDRERLFSHSAWNWVRDRPEAAAAYILATPEGSSRDSMVRSLVQNWGSNDPDAALAWVAENVEESKQQDAYGRIAASMASVNPEGAIELIYSNSDVSKVSSHVVSVVRTWARNSPDNAIAWVDGLEDGKVKDRALASISSSMSYNNPAAAADLALAIKDEKSKKNAFRSAYYQWCDLDPVGSGKFLEKFDVGQTRDAAVEIYCQRAVEYEPEFAAAWSETIESESKRWTAMSNVARRWLKDDPDAATKWLNASSMPEDKKNKLLK